MGTVALAVPPDHTNLVSLATFKAELGECDSALAAAHLAEASSRIETLLGRPIVRAQYTETLRGSASSRILLTVRPVAAIVSVSYQGDAQTLSEFSIDSREAGFLYRSDSAWFDDDSDPSAWSITYTAGYFVPDDDYLGSLSVASTDDSYNAAAGGLPTHLVAGDWIRPASFTNAVNNRQQRVVTATTSKITVPDGLSTEAAAIRRINVSNLPAAISRAALMLAKESYSQHGSAATSGPLTSETIVGVSSLTWSSGSSSTSGSSAADQSAAALLFPFMDF